ncbi:hypothetical protein B0H13DRAFT_2105181 [Mycena leptocephala]|nr:hypothetical protein B0H13DRAFT_2105181 [Mycena leptocephala]
MVVEWLWFKFRKLRKLEERKYFPHAVNGHVSKYLVHDLDIQHQMKRGAERQITKGEGEDEPEVEEVSGDSAFHKADDAILATRKIKGMPRRVGGSSSSTASSSDPGIVNGAAENPGTPPPSKFSSFSGFGTPSSSGNAFSFVPPSSSPSFPPVKPTSSIFGSTPGTPTPTTLFSSGAPAVSETASNAAKTFASFLGNSSSKPTVSPTPLPPQPTAPVPTSGGDSGDEAALKYFSSLRGLNVSILAAITKAIDQDPFADIATLLTRYSSLRVDVQKEYDDRTAKTDVPARSSAPSPSPFGAPPPSSAPAPFSAPAAPLKMPAAPAAFAGFGKPATSTPAAPKTNGVADPPAPANPFAFPASTSTSASTSTTPKPSMFAPLASSPFASSSSSSTPSAFSSATPSSLFGSGASSTAKPFGSAASPSPFGAAKSSPSLFGSGGGSGFGSPSGSPTPFPFGGGGSIGNPVGFSFASPKADAGKEKEKEGADEKKGEDAAEDGDGDGDGTEAGTTDDSSGSAGMLFGNDTPTGLDAEGEGEEDEETVQTARIKAFRMRKKEEGGDGGWLDIGIGYLRLKKHKETSARRLLLRNSNSGKIQINFALYAGLKTSLSKKSLTFVGHDTAGEPQTYSLRFRSEDAKEIAQIKAS